MNIKTIYVSLGICCFIFVVFLIILYKSTSGTTTGNKSTIGNINSHPINYQSDSRIDSDTNSSIVQSTINTKAPPNISNSSGQTSSISIPSY